MRVLNGCPALQSNVSNSFLSDRSYPIRQIMRATTIAFVLAAAVMAAVVPTSGAFFPPTSIPSFQTCGQLLDFVESTTTTSRQCLAMSVQPCCGRCVKAPKGADCKQCIQESTQRNMMKLMMAGCFKPDGRRLRGVRRLGSIVRLRKLFQHAKRRRLGGICGVPTRYSLMGPSMFSSRSAYDKYVCDADCSYEYRMCIYRTPNCGYPNVGDREQAMKDECVSTDSSCRRRCSRRRLMVSEDELVDGVMF